MTSASPTVAITGNQNITAGNDVHIEHLYVEHSLESDFIEPVLADYKAPQYPTPQSINDFVTILQQQRLLVLYESSDRDTSKLVRHIGWYFQEAQQGTTVKSPTVDYEMPTLEWQPGSNPRDLLYKLFTTTKPTLFLLPEVAPPTMSQTDLNRMQARLAERKHFMILTTSASEQAWNCAKHENYWQTLEEETLYSHDELANWLVYWLGENEAILPTGLVSSQTAIDQPLYAHMSPLDIVRRVGTFHNLQVFTEGLPGLAATLTDTTFLDLVQKAATSDKIPLDQQLSAWTAKLAPRHQLLALNLSLLGGMYENQFFAVLERLYARVWRKRDASLRAFDYDDLLALEPWVDLVETRIGERFVNLVVTDQRRILLRQAWHRQRRQIIAALPVLAELVRASVRPFSFDLELFSKDGRRYVLRDVIGEILSELGLISDADVQPAYIDLAAHHNVGVQYVAANGLARWRQHGCDERLFKLLKQWRSGEKRELFTQVVGQRGRPDIGYDSAIATVALTLGVASRFDLPNQLDPQLMDLFEILVRSESKLVRERLYRHALPRLVDRHLFQIRKLLSTLTGTDEQREFVIAALARAYSTVPTDVATTIIFWYEHCSITRPNISNSGTRTSRESLLLTVLALYIEIAAGDITGPTAITWALDQLPRVLPDTLQNEHQPEVRAAALALLTTAVDRHFTYVSPQLASLASVLSPKESQELISALTKLYQKQRGAQVSGQRQAKLGDKQYSVWPDTGVQRPPTDVEQTVLGCLKTTGNPHAQRLALQAQIAFADALDLELAKHSFPSPPVVYKAKPGRWGIPWSDHWYYRQLVPWLTTLDAQTHRSSIRALLPEAIAQHNAHTSALDYSLRLWKRSGNWRVNGIGKRLQNSLLLAELWWLVVAVVAMVAALVLSNIALTVFRLR